MNTNFSSRIAKYGLASAAVAALAVPAAVLGLAAPASAAAACGKAGTNIDGSAYVRQTAGVAANMRSGSSTSCGITGYADNQNTLNYYCFTATASSTWTYLYNVTDGTYGWVSDSLLPKNSDGVTRGSLSYCGF
ncbi:SH3 domain-containing protein [Streptomyces sp. W16]|uniref:SH3 domain-containing protein n=1 Tax=Streptomyces sp. W16 TaxID=3076631 RepID=UPI00295C35E8|nr:SH3 domain-containing protein [Streptomyces sp. W16]MDV9173636.1 SH3 domain-containing protein [Streptomyces sp. W16]